MRISDWSSDVCSSDLRAPAAVMLAWFEGKLSSARPIGRSLPVAVLRPSVAPQVARRAPPPTAKPLALVASQARSEEHTSELQSLMRISYAVFCLKKNSCRQKQNTRSSRESPHITTAHT